MSDSSELLAEAAREVFDHCTYGEVFMDATIEDARDALAAFDADSALREARDAVVRAAEALADMWEVMLTTLVPFSPPADLVAAVRVFRGLRDE